MGVFPRTLYVAIDESSEEILKYLNGNNGDSIPDMEDTSNAYELPVSDGQYGGSLIRFRTKDTVTPAIAAHESFHAAMSFCSYLNINFDTGDNNEHVAYMIEWLVARCFDALELYKKDEI